MQTIRKWITQLLRWLRSFFQPEPIQGEPVVSALSIQPTFPVFTDIDGQPLEAGYIFIGAANLNPQTNPIAVFFDASLTIAAPQPIRTLAGYPANSGTPARLYVGSDYSIQVQNKNGSTVYSAPSATERYSDVVISGVNGEDVIYDPPFTNAVQTNVEAKLAQTVSVKDFGAVGNGVTDDTAAIQAALDASASVYFPEGVYALSDQIELNSGQKLHGDGYASVLLSTGTNKNIVYGDNISHIEIESLFFQGNATGTGTAGHGIRLETVSYINIHDCYFDGIGNTTGYASNISGDTCSFAIITRNIFLGTSGGSQTGADIGFGYFGKQCLITNNISYSNQDSMISLAAVGVTFRDNQNHVVSNNIGIRRDTNTSRSGIIITYNDEAAYTSVIGNILYNWIWNGIYIQSGTSNTARSGGLTIQGNVVRYCGGGSVNLSAGIWLSGNNGLTCTGNLVEYTSYNSSEVYRGNPNDGIRIQNSATNISVVGNVVRKSKGSGALLQPLTGFEQRDIVLSQNIFEDNEGGGVLLAPSNTGTIKNLAIVGNVIKQETFDAHGINITPSGGAPSPENLLIEGNIINGVSGSIRSGIRTTVAAPSAWVIRGNLIDTFDKGFECATFPADQLYGTACILDGNTIKNCTTGYAIGSAGAAFNGYVFNPTYINVTTKHASANYSDAVNLGNGNVNIRRAASPTGGTWRAGDQVTYLAPTAGGFIGAVCVSAGAPGTWKTFGAISV